jgi:hypothetical protein
MADATVTLGLNASEFKSGLQRASAEVDNFSRKAAKTGGGRGAGISMQLQDIAVQAQMGTSALTIFSQQAPQILSVFGNFGALAGGFAAVGGAAYTFGQQSSEAFRTVLKDAAALNSEIGRLAGSGATLESSLDAFTRIKDAQKAMSGESQARQDGGGFGQMSQELLAVFGLAESNYDQSKEAEIATVALKKQQVRLQNEIVKASGDEVMLAQLKAAGDDKAVDALDRKLKLEAQIRKIKSYGLETGAESKLIENATAISELQGKQKTKTFDIAKNLQEQANAANSILAPYKEFLNFLDEAKRKQDAIDSKKDADRQATQSKIEGQKEAAQALQDEIDLLTVRASGDEKAIRDAEAALAIKQRTRQIQRDMNVDAKTARGIAEQIASLEQKGKRGSGADTDGDGFISKREQRKSDLEQKRGQRKADSIKGFSRDRAGLSAFGGLFEHSFLNTGSSGNRTIPVGKGFIGMRNELDSTEKRSITPNLFDFFDGKRPESSSDKIAAEMRQLKDIIKERLTVD